MSNSKTLSEKHPSWRRWIFGWLPFWFSSYIVIKGAVLRPEEIPAVFTLIDDKLFHFLQYFFLFFFSVNAFYRAGSLWLRLRPRFYSVLYCLGMGILTECLQLNVPGRSADGLDWTADAGGAILALGIYTATAHWIIRSRTKTKLSP